MQVIVKSVEARRVCLCHKGLVPQCSSNNSVGSVIMSLSTLFHSQPHESSTTEWGTRSKHTANSLTVWHERSSPTLRHYGWRIRPDNACFNQLQWKLCHKNATVVRCFHRGWTRKQHLSRVWISLKKIVKESVKWLLDPLACMPYLQGRSLSILTILTLVGTCFVHAVSQTIGLYYGGLL